jgi:hypothetical protein
MPRSGLPVGLLLLGSLWIRGAAAQGPPDKPPATPAQPAAAAPAADSVSARELGLAEALLEYCAQNDPPGAAQVRARVQKLVHGASREQLAGLRKSPEYLSARDSERNFVAKVEPRNAPRLCSGRAAQKKAQNNK